jgi:hypothetical protein
MYTACPSPIGTRELNTTMDTSGRTATLRECLRSGDESQ